jgi:hypothetical protein
VNIHLPHCSRRSTSAVSTKTLRSASGWCAMSCINRGHLLVEMRNACNPRPRGRHKECRCFTSNL